MEEPTVAIEYGPCRLADENVTIVVNVINAGREPIDRVGVSVIYNYETPQDETEAFKREHPEMDVESAYIERQEEHLFARDADEPLAPGASREFLLPLQAIPQLRSCVESLSLEHFHVAVELDGESQLVIDGPQLYELVQTIWPAE